MIGHSLGRMESRIKMFKPHLFFFGGGGGGGDYFRRYRSGRYNFTERDVVQIADTVADILCLDGGKFKASFAPPVSNATAALETTSDVAAFEGYLWYARYRPEIYSSLVAHVLETTLRGKPDGLVYWELFKLKEPFARPGQNTSRFTQTTPTAASGPTPATPPPPPPPVPYVPYTMGIKGSTRCRKRIGTPVATAKSCLAALAWFSIVPHTREADMLDGVFCYKDKYGVGHADGHHGRSSFIICAIAPPQDESTGTATAATSTASTPPIGTTPSGRSRLARSVRFEDCGANKIVWEHALDTTGGAPQSKTPTDARGPKPTGPVQVVATEIALQASPTPAAATGKVPCCTTPGDTGTGTPALVSTPSNAAQHPTSRSTAWAYALFVIPCAFALMSARHTVHPDTTSATHTITAV